MCRLMSPPCCQRSQSRTERRDPAPAHWSKLSSGTAGWLICRSAGLQLIKDGCFHREQQPSEQSRSAYANVSEPGEDPLSMKRAATSNLADTHEIKKKVTLGKSKTIGSKIIFYTESENKTAFLLLCILLLLIGGGVVNTCWY